MAKVDMLGKGGPSVKQGRASSSNIEAQSPTPNPEIPNKHCVYTSFFKKFARTSACSAVVA